MTSWNGSVTFITGASRGIGAAVARAAAARGARLGLIARAKDELERVLASTGGTGAVATADVASRAEIEGAVESLTRELGAPDILVNNAGIGWYASVAETPVEEFERLIQVNYLGTVYATKAVLPSMIERRSGHIVMLASIVARIGAPNEGAYSASKFAMAGLSESLSLEVAHRGIKLSMVDPGPVETSFFDARGMPYQRSKPRPVPAEEVARAVIGVVERNRAEVFVPRWLRFPVIIKALMPGVFRSGTLRNFGDELRG